MKITFTRNSDIWVMDADGGAETQLTTSRRVEFTSTFSPAGNRIAFNREDRTAASASGPCPPTGRRCRASGRSDGPTSPPTGSPARSDVRLT